MAPNLPDKVLSSGFRFPGWREQSGFARLGGLVETAGIRANIGTVGAKCRLAKALGVGRGAACRVRQRALSSHLDDDVSPLEGWVPPLRTAAAVGRRRTEDNVTVRLTEMITEYRMP